MLKIIAGEYRSRRLESPKDEDRTTRPYLHRVKESVFGMLHEWFEDARVLDLFAGVGTVGLEAVSRGAAQVLMVERDRRVHALLTANIEKLGCADRATAINGDALGATCLLRAPRPVDLVFVDPPYLMMTDEESRERVLDQMGRCAPIMNPRGFLISRSPIGADAIGRVPEGLIGPEEHTYGPGQAVLLYQPDPDAPATGTDAP